MGRQLCFKLLLYLILWFSISAQDGDGTPVDVQVKDNGNGTYSCSYTPRKPVKHTAMVSWGGVNIPDSPFRVSTQESLVSASTFYQGTVSGAALFSTTDEYRSRLSSKQG